jgi:hypothetical protein
VGAVSMRLMPHSRAPRQVEMATSSGIAPQSRPPIAQVPRPIRETAMPAMVVVSMHNILQGYGIRVRSPAGWTLQIISGILLL